MCTYLRNAKNHKGSRESDSDCGDAFVGIIAPPIMDKRHFEGLNSPVGRLGTPYTTPEEHCKRFFGDVDLDVKWKTVYTSNTVFSDPAFNINTTLMYGKQALETNEFFLHKYLYPNPTSTAHLSAQQQHYNRLRIGRSRQGLQQNETMEIHGSLDMSNPSLITGCAIPKYCYTNSESLNSTDQHANPSALKNTSIIFDKEKSWNWFIPSCGTLDKFDQGGVSHNNFTL